jgi:hypothetical protein
MTRQEAIDQEGKTMTGNNFTPNNPHPESQEACDHANVITSTDMLGRRDGYDVCINCGAREYYVHHDQRPH